MEKPYCFDLEEDTDPLQDTCVLPAWCSYPMAFARKQVHYELPHMELLSQQLSNPPFYIDLVDLKPRQAVHVPFHVRKKQLFLYFMLEGSALFTTEGKRPIIMTHSNTYLMSFYDVGRYAVQADAGHHTALVVSIQPKWIERMYDNCPNLQYILYKFKQENKAYDTMSPCRMDSKIQRWLYKIYSYSQNNMGAIDGNLRKYISYVLQHYDTMLDNQQDNIAYMVKRYIEEHLDDPGLSVGFLATHFCVTERTLLNHFKRLYQVGVQQYYTDLRMARALSYMEDKGIAARDVYREVGYTDERSFRSALNRYLKRRS